MIHLVHIIYMIHMVLTMYKIHVIHMTYIDVGASCGLLQLAVRRRGSKRPYDVDPYPVQDCSCRARYGLAGPEIKKIDCLILVLEPDPRAWASELHRRNQWRFFLAKCKLPMSHG